MVKLLNLLQRSHAYLATFIQATVPAAFSGAVYELIEILYQSLLCAFISEPLSQPLTQPLSAPLPHPP